MKLTDLWDEELQMYILNKDDLYKFYDELITIHNEKFIKYGEVWDFSIFDECVIFQHMETEDDSYTNDNQMNVENILKTLNENSRVEIFKNGRAVSMYDGKNSIDECYNNCNVISMEIFGNSLIINI